MKAYISGAITNDEKYKEKFEKAQLFLQKKGYDVLNPAELIEQTDVKTYKNYIDEALLLLMTADIIYILPTWTKSYGAALEN